jgi:hypothetical protein
MSENEFSKAMRARRKANRVLSQVYEHYIVTGHDPVVRGRLLRVLELRRLIAKRALELMEAQKA